MKLIVALTVLLLFASYAVGKDAGTTDVDTAASANMDEKATVRSTKTVSRRQMRQLTEAAKDGDEHKVRTILSKGAPADSVDDYHVSALHYAAEGGHMPILRALLEAGADPNFRLDDRSNFRKGETPLHWAATQDRAEVTQALLDAGADAVGTSEKGVAAIHLAAGLGFLETVKVYLAAGVDPNIEADNQFGSTPMHLASTGENLETLTALHVAGGSITKKNRRGASPIHGAFATGNVDIAHYLLDNGAVWRGVEAQNADGQTPFDVLLEQQQHGRVTEKQRARIEELLHAAEARIPTQIDPLPGFDNKHHSELWKRTLII